jgi:hypothetical protein
LTNAAASHLSRAAKFRAVGNGVPVPMAFAVACAIRDRAVTTGLKLCECGCGRAISPRAITATPACRKRQERKRRARGHVPESHAIDPNRVEIHAPRSVT